jgi:hypothetical protein
LVAARQLVHLDKGIRPNVVKDLVADRDQDDVRRALAATRRARPTDAFGYFKKALGSRVLPDAPRERKGVTPLKPISEEPY